MVKDNIPEVGDVVIIKKGTDSNWDPVMSKYLNVPVIVSNVSHDINHNRFSVSFNNENSYSVWYINEWQWDTQNRIFEMAEFNPIYELW